MDTTETMSNSDRIDATIETVIQAIVDRKPFSLTLEDGGLMIGCYAPGTDTWVEHRFILEGSVTQYREVITYG